MGYNSPPFQVSFGLETLGEEPGEVMK